MNVVATIFTKTTPLICNFHVGKNVRGESIRECMVKHKVAKVDE